MKSKNRKYVIVCLLFFLFSTVSPITIEKINELDTILKTSGTAFPVIENWEFDGSSTPSTTLTCSKPSGVNIGDLLLLIPFNDDTSNFAQFTDDKTNWTMINEAGTSITDSHIAVFYKIADGFEPSTESVTSVYSHDWGMFYVVINNVNTVDPIDEVGVDDVGSGSTHVIEAITTNEDYSTAFYVDSYDGGDGEPFAESSDWVEMDVYTSGDTFDDACGLFGAKNITSAGTTGDATITTPTSDGFAGFLFSIEGGTPISDDESPPTWDTLTESDDPLELGSNETININVYDDSTIDDVYLEFGGSNHSMSFISGDTYRYTNWLPISLGVHNYTIHMIDEFGNTNQTGVFNITVIETDESPPTWDTLTESDDPLELGSNETININVYDDSTIDDVYLEFGGSNHSMSFISGDIYRYTNWYPISLGVHNYTIHMIDEFGNTNQTGVFNITVILPSEGVEEEETDYSIVNVLVMSLMMIIQSFYYFKVSIKSMIRLPVILTTGSFSLLMTPLLMINQVPATPYIQIYFILYQVVMLFFTAYEYKLIKNG